MTIFYLDYELGNDANDGSDWANAWKTITLGALAARIAPGDVIRIAKSPAPTAVGTDATWTDLSKTVTMAAAQTKAVTQCDASWTASANVTATAPSTLHKEGAGHANLVLATAFATGLAAYFPLGGIEDFSGYQKLTFWFRNTAAIAADTTFRLCLCSDTIGAVIVDSFYIPVVPSTGRWIPLTITKSGGGNLGAAIQSIALYADTDVATNTILLDNIQACTTSGLNLQSLISKSSAEQGVIGDEAWYAIQSIVGTTILLDNDTNTIATAGRGYSGTTETVPLYKRETIKTAMVVVAATNVETFGEAGTEGASIQYQGGWDTGTTLQTGETYLDGLNGNGIVFFIARAFITLNRFSFTRYSVCVSLNTTNNSLIGHVSNANNNARLCEGNNHSNHNRFDTVLHANNNSGSGVVFSGNFGNNKVGYLGEANNNLQYGISFATCRDCEVEDCGILRNNGIYAINNLSSSTSVVRNAQTSNNASGGLGNAAGTLYLFNTVVDEATEAVMGAGYSEDAIFSHRHDDTDDNHVTFLCNASVRSEATIRHTASGLSWKFDLEDIDRTSIYPLDQPIARIAVAANALVTVKAWVYKSHATDIAGYLVCKGGQIAGVDNDVVDTAADVATTWEELTITFTPTKAGVVEICGRAVYVAGIGSVYFDDMTITQA